MKRLGLAVSFMVVLLTPPAMSTTLYVPGDYPTIQQAVDAAADEGDTVAVDAGYYPEDVFVSAKLIHIIGVDGSESTSADSFAWNDPSPGDAPGGSLVGFEVLGTVLAAQLQDDFYIRQCIVDGFVYCDIELHDTDRIRLESSEFYSSVDLSASNEFASISVSDCVFHNASLNILSNDDASVSGSEFYGDGMYVLGETSLSVTGNSLQNGGIRVETVDILGGSVSNNTVVGTDVAIEAAGDFNNGADVDVDGNTIADCDIGILTHSYVFVEQNNISGCGDGVYLGEDCTATGNVIFDCHNGLFVFDGIPNLEQPHVQNNTVFGCSGDGIRYFATDVGNLGDLTNNIVVGNNKGVIVPAGIDPALIECNDVWSNAAGNWTGIADPTGTNGNISMDPLFCDATLPDPDLRLQPTSPCAPFTPPNSECDLIGALPAGCGPTSVEEAAPSPGCLLAPASPNPFAHSTRITYTIPESGGPVNLRILDVSGRLVRTLMEGSRPAGIHTVSWDGRNEAGASVGNGLYFYEMTFEGHTETRRLVLIR